MGRFQLKRGRQLFAGLCLACSLCSGAAVAQEADEATSDHASDAKRSSARQLATEASADYRAGKFEDAYDKFNRAFRLVEVPALGVWSARSLRQMNRLVEASERYRDVLKAGVKAGDPPNYEEALKDARAELDELLPLIPNLTINLLNAKSADVEVTLDGETVDPALVGAKQRVDPGKHVIVGKRGGEVVTQEIALVERDSKELALKFKPGYKKPVAVAASSDDARTGLTPMQTAGVASMAAGGAFIIAAGVTTGIALDKQSKLKDSCGGTTCPAGKQGDVDAFNTMKTLSTLSLIGVGVFGALGVTLYVVGSPEKNEEPQMSMDFLGNGLQLRGQF